MKRRQLEIIGVKLKVPDKMRQALEMVFLGKKTPAAAEKAIYGAVTNTVGRKAAAVAAELEYCERVCGKASKVKGASE
jgi:hypothetical protein